VTEASAPGDQQRPAEHEQLPSSRPARTPTYTRPFLEPPVPMVRGMAADSDRSVEHDITGASARDPGRAEMTKGASQSATAAASIAAATVLVALKLGTGLITGSLGLVSAGIESSGDVIAAVLTFFAIRLSGRPADVEHPYGHRRAENLAALGEASILSAGGIFVVAEAVSSLVAGHSSLTPHWYVYVVIGVALLIDATRVSVSLRTSVTYRSAALRSNAFHFAGDMLGSLAVLGGLIAVSAGFPQGDAVAALVVAAIIFAAAARLIGENARVLMDTAPADAREQARRAVESVGGGFELRRLRLRASGGRYFADAVVAVPPGAAVVEGHATADVVEDAVRAALPDTDVVVHVEPRQEGLDLRDRVLAVGLAEPLVREAHDIVLYQHNGEVSISLHLKLPADTSLDAAHEVAERVEATLRAEPTVRSVQTHLEPLEQPLATATATSADTGDETVIRRLVSQRTGQPPRELSLLDTVAGRVVFLTICVASSVGLAEAHQTASRLEEDIRTRRPELADVVVHTEPGHRERSTRR
jgi:cation diffusion facilitator family transporter